MADIRGVTVGCNDECGCPVPCPGGTSCGCSSMKATSGEGAAGHNKCSCGEHCSCNPCTCPRSVVTTGVGKVYCKCGAGCACPTCSS